MTTGNGEVFDPKQVAIDVETIANSDSPIGLLVNEALQVIDQALDTYGCVFDVLKQSDLFNIGEDRTMSP